MGYNIIKESKQFHTQFKVLEKDEKFVYAEDLQIHYLELNKLPNKEIEELEGVELLITFFKESGKEDNEEILKKLGERSENVKDAMKSLETVSADERMLEIHRAREKSRIDMKSKLIYAEKKGLQKGLQQGLQQGVIKIAEEMFRLGVDIEIIEKVTKLSGDELKQIEEKVKRQQN